MKQILCITLQQIVILFQLFHLYFLSPVQVNKTHTQKRNRNHQRISPTHNTTIIQLLESLYYALSQVPSDVYLQVTKHSLKTSQREWNQSA